MKRNPRYFIIAICVLACAFGGERLTHSAYSQSQRPKLKIEGIWTFIYHDWRNSPVCMLPYHQKGTGGSIGPLEWKITHKLFYELGSYPVSVSAYELKLENGVTCLDLTPLDQDGKKVEKERQRGIVVLKDDFMFLTLGTKKRITSLSVSADESESLYIFRRGKMRYIPGVDSAGEFRDEKR